MVTFQINGQQRTGNDITEQWINDQFRSAHPNGQPPCVRVTVQTADCNANLTTPPCGGGGGGGRAPNAQETQLFKLWEQAHLNDGRYSAGNVISFLKRLKDVC